LKVTIVSMTVQNSTGHIELMSEGKSDATL